MPQLSPRAAFMARQAGRKADPLIEYEVLDPHHKPDLNGELAGGKVYKKGGKEYVMLTEQQARFYLDSGGIQDVQKASEDKEAGPQKTLSQQKSEGKMAKPQGRTGRQQNPPQQPPQQEPPKQ